MVTKIGDKSVTNGVCHMSKKLPAGLEMRNGSFRVRKVVPADCADVLGQKVLTHTLEYHGMPVTDALTAIEMYPTVWRDFQARIIRARAGYKTPENLVSNDNQTPESVMRYVIAKTLNEKIQSYIVRNDGSDMRGNQLKAQLFDRLDTDILIEDEFDKLLEAERIQLIPNDPLREEMLREYKAGKMTILSQANKDWAVTATTQQLEQLLALDASDHTVMAKASFKDHTKPKNKPMMMMSAWFDLYLSKKDNTKGLTPDEVRKRESQGIKVLDSEKIKDYETWQKHKLIFASFMDVVSDKPLNYVTRHDAIEFVEMLTDYPTTMRSDVKAMTFKQKIEWSRENEAETLTEQTIDKWVGRLKATWRKAVITYRHDYPDLYQIWDDMAEFIKGRANGKKRPFTPHEIKAIFTKPMFTGFKAGNHDRGYRNERGNKLLQDHNFWLFLLCAHHGNRLSEYARRKVSEVVTDEDGVIHLRISEAKNGTSVRRVPVHPFCLEMGFMSYVESIKAAGHETLFPQLPESTDTREKSDHFSQWAGRWFEENGFNFNDPIDGKATFACWRHTFSTQATSSGIGLSDMDAAYITGHSQSNVQKRIYIQPSNKTMKANLDKVWLEGFPYDEFRKLYEIHRP
jgi:integrase